MTKFFLMSRVKFKNEQNQWWKSTGTTLRTALRWDEKKNQNYRKITLTDRKENHRKFDCNEGIRVRKLLNVSFKKVCVLWVSSVMKKRYWIVAFKLEFSLLLQKDMHFLYSTSTFIIRVIDLYCDTTVPPNSKYYMLGG